MLVCVAAGTDTKAVSAKLTANPGPAPLICCARQDQPSFKHWLPCAGLRWSCAGWRGRSTASRLLCTHSRSPSSHPLFLTTTTTTTPPPIAAPTSKTSSVTRRPTSPPCDRSVKIQLSHFSLPSAHDAPINIAGTCEEARLLLCAAAVALGSYRHSMLVNPLPRFN